MLESTVNSGPIGRTRYASFNRTISDRRVRLMLFTEKLLQLPYVRPPRTVVICLDNSIATVS